MLSELDTQQNIRDILVWCPNYVGAKWRNNALKCKNESDRYPTLEEFVTFISKIAADSCDPLYGNEAVKGMTSGRRSGLANSTSATQSQAFSQNVPKSISRTDQSRIPRACVVCDQFHKVYTCERFKSMSPNYRLQVASRNNLCFNCLLPGLRVYRCRNPMKCSVPECGRRHNKLLHTVQTSAEVRSPGTATDSAAATGSVSASVTDPCAYLPVVKVVINGKYSALAMLDTVSTNTFISSRLVSKLPKSNVTATYDMNTSALRNPYPIRLVFMWSYPWCFGQ